MTDQHPSSIPLPSSTRTDSTRSDRDSQNGSRARPPTQVASSVHTRHARQHVGTGKWPTTPRSSSRTSTNERRVPGPSTTALHRPDEHSSSRETRGESFLHLTDTTRSVADSTSSLGSIGERVIQPRSQSTRDERGSKPSSLLPSPTMPLSSHTTLADVTMRPEDPSTTRYQP